MHNLADPIGERERGPRSARPGAAAIAAGLPRLGSVNALKPNTRLPMTMVSPPMTATPLHRGTKRSR